MHGRAPEEKHVIEAQAGDNASDIGAVVARGRGPSYVNFDGVSELEALTACAVGLKRIR